MFCRGWGPEKIETDRILKKESDWSGLETAGLEPGILVTEAGEPANIVTGPEAKDGGSTLPVGPRLLTVLPAELTRSR